MPTVRKEILANNEIYHVYNRSVGMEDCFTNKRDLNRILSLINYYRYIQKIKYSDFKRLPAAERQMYLSEYKKSKPLVEIYAYALMPDHFHLLLKQTLDDGIKKLLSNFQNSFAKYYNTKNERLGSLFLRPFKAKRITTEEAFLHISRYIHLNPTTSYLVEYKNHHLYPWTSYLNSLGKRKSDLVNTELIIDIVGSRKKYEEFVANQVDYQRKLRMIKKYLLD